MARFRGSDYKWKPDLTKYATVLRVAATRCDTQRHLPARRFYPLPALRSRRMSDSPRLERRGSSSPPSLPPDWGPLEPLLFDHGVDVVINGHVHAYERTVGVRAGVPDQCGPTHLVVGDGGNYEGPYGGGWRAPQPDWSAFREGSFGAGRLEILDEKHATWEWRRTTCVAPAGTTALNETWYEPIGGGNSSRSCASVGDVSAQAMEPVDRVEIVRDVDACPEPQTTRALVAAVAPTIEAEQQRSQVLGRAHRG